MPKTFSDKVRESFQADRDSMSIKAASKKNGISYQTGIIWAKGNKQGSSKGSKSLNLYHQLVGAIRAEEIAKIKENIK